MKSRGNPQAQPDASRAEIGRISRFYGQVDRARPAAFGAIYFSETPRANGGWITSGSCVICGRMSIRQYRIYRRLATILLRTFSPTHRARKLEAQTPDSKPHAHRSVRMPWQQCECGNNLLVAQSHDGVHAGRAPGGDVAGQNRDRGKNSRYGDQGGYVGGLHAYNKLDMRRVRANDARRPIVTPMAASTRPWPITNRSNWPVSAPRAMRIPISFVRCCTE
jgi:hypothetical protein